jgi:tetratricopeptide (TPR) repeat protein
MHPERDPFSSSRGSAAERQARGSFRLVKRHDPCEAIQLDLSCMVDGEADAAAVRRALIHVEVCPECSAFLEHVRGHIELHRDLCDPRLLMRRLRSIDGMELFTRSSIRANLRRLSEFFYQLGKAYLLLATDQRYLLQVFEEPVPIASVEKRGLGFVEDHLASRRSAPEREEPAKSDDADDLRELELEAGASYDWVKARSLLGDQLERTTQNLEKARLLLEEALLVRPSYAEARLYLGFYHQNIGDHARAELEYRRVFETARKVRNRAHAAVQLGVLQHERGELASAVRCFRWVTRAGLVRRDGRFFFVFYNLALLYARLGDYARCAKCFEILYHRHRAQSAEIERFLTRAEAFRETLREQPELAADLERACPAWFPLPARPEASAARGAEGAPSPRRPE